MSANKGAVALLFKLDETSFTFINCHLCHGLKYAEYRREELEQILRNVHCKLGFTDHTVILGDLNARIDLPRCDVLLKVASKDFAYLKQYD
jgi:endonuclease/exonuclease/phosphatase family metal-dependent hydrolase